MTYYDSETCPLGVSAEAVRTLDPGAVFAEPFSDNDVFGCKFVVAAPGSDTMLLMFYAAPAPVGDFTAHVLEPGPLYLQAVELQPSRPLAGGTLQPFCGQESDGTRCFASWYNDDIEVVAYGTAFPDGEAAAEWLEVHLFAIASGIASLPSS